jgi:hypothetical protein
VIDLAVDARSLQNSVVNDARAFLLSQVSLALDRDQVSLVDLSSVVPDPSALRPAEKAAWIELHYWEDDAAIRSSSRPFRDYSVRRLRHLLHSLKPFSAINPS